MYSLKVNSDSFVLVSKYPGTNFHKGNAPVGLVQKIRNDLGLKTLYPLHRLDIVTSGLLLFAKDRKSVRALAAQFREHTISKFYIALAGAHPQKKQGTVKGDMVRGRNGAWLLSRTTTNPAVTSFISTGLGNGLRLYLLKPLTGKTHQLRVALKSLGVPVLGDPVYYKKKDSRFSPDRTYLHSFAIKFTLEGEEYAFTDIPETGSYFISDEFTTALQKYADPWSFKWPNVKV
ncbi:MAG: RNA pseudouridine synthase [Fibrobacter sp.]|nr:RNA pseudouridine synthase [Fibrobacter sp.]